MKLLSIRRSDLTLALLVVLFAGCLSVESRSTSDAETKNDTDDGADLALADGGQEFLEGLEEDSEDGKDSFEDEDEEEGPASVMKSVGRNFTVAAGETIWLPCDVTNPDNVVLMWKNTTTVLFQQKVNATDNSRLKLESNYTLRISNLKPEDEGTYTCMMLGSSLSPQIHHNVRLLRSPVISEMRPHGEERLVKAGSSLEIFCIANGVPTPTINWSKSGLRLTSKTVEFRKQSLFIPKVHHSHSGTYQCLASNGIGQPAHDAVNIKVLHKPEVHFTHDLINSDVGVEAILSCRTTSEPLPIIKWLKDNETINNLGNFRITNQQPNSTLIIKSVRPEDFGTYTCEAENQYGKHHRSVKLVREPVLSEHLHGDGPALRWTFHSHQPLRQIEIMYRRIDDGPEDKWTIVRPTVEEQRSPKYITRHVLEDLPTGQYIARVKASNDNGWSVISNEYIFNSYMEENEVRPEDQIYQAPRESTDPNNSATGLYSSLILPSLSLCLFYRIL